jgi:hypothetical protein
MGKSRQLLMFSPGFLSLEFLGHRFSLENHDYGTKREHHCTNAVVWTWLPSSGCQGKGCEEHSRKRASTLTSHSGGLLQPPPFGERSKFKPNVLRLCVKDLGVLDL